MSDHLSIASAGNVLPAALAALRELGYVVTLTNNGRLLKAEGGTQTFIAEDPLQLLGLAKLHEVRGNDWMPSEAEVDRYLEFDVAYTEATPQRTDVWEESGAVHILCATSFGDPVELSEEEARVLSARLSRAITAAGLK